MFWTAMMWTAGIIVGIPVGIIICKVLKELLIYVLSKGIQFCEYMDRRKRFP